MAGRDAGDHLTELGIDGRGAVDVSRGLTKAVERQKGTADDDAPSWIIGQLGGDLV